MVIYQMFLIHIPEHTRKYHQYLLFHMSVTFRFCFKKIIFKSIYQNCFCEKLFFFFPQFFTWYLKEQWKKNLREHLVASSSTHCLYNTILQRSAIIEILNSGTNGGTVSKFLIHPIVYHLFQTSVTIANATLYLKA